MRLAPAIGCVAAIAFGTGCGSASKLPATPVPQPAPAPAPARDHFSGVATETGGGPTGRVTIDLFPRGNGAKRSVTVRITSACSNCLKLTGTLTGQIVKHRRLPDVGGSFTIAASGRVAPLGAVNATGSVTGAGFIASGHETLRLALAGGGSKTVLVSALSGAVRGFTSP